MTHDQFRILTPGLKQTRRDELYEPFIAAAVEFDIDTPARLAAFMAQILHESSGFRYFREIWGPTAAQRNYEGRKDLGNTEPGDGKRFLGRGPIQITGRANYSKYGDLLKLPLIEKPELLEQPPAGFRSAALYWRENGLNPLADLDSNVSFREITRRINGGYNGLEDRKRLWAKAKGVIYAGA